MSEYQGFDGYAFDRERPKELRKDTFEVASFSLASETHLERNEDTIVVEPKMQLYGVFDGMGGHASGDKASRLAGESVQQHFHDLDEATSLSQLESQVREALRIAHEEVVKNNQAEFSNSGTTGVLVKVLKEKQGLEHKVVVGCIGDSRAYKVKVDGTIEQITCDDEHLYERNTTLTQEERLTKRLEALRQRQRLSLAGTVDELEQLPEIDRIKFEYRNELKQFIGDMRGNEGPNPFITTAGLRDGETLLIVSDGISDNLTDTEIAEIAHSAPDVQALKQNLAYAAQQRSRQSESGVAKGLSSTQHIRAKADDMSAIAVRFGRLAELIRPVQSRLDPDRSDEWKAVKQSPDPANHERTTVPTIQEAKDFDGLFATIRALPGGGLLGSRDIFHDSSSLLSLIDTVRKSDPWQLSPLEPPVTHITSADGLRDKVYELVQAEAEQIRSDIERARSFSDLERVLLATPGGGLYGSDGNLYGVESMLGDLAKIRQARRTRNQAEESAILTGITKRYGLRKKVSELLNG